MAILLPDQDDSVCYSKVLKKQVVGHGNRFDKLDQVPHNYLVQRIKGSKDLRNLVLEGRSWQIPAKSGPGQACPASL